MLILHPDGSARWGVDPVEQLYKDEVRVAEVFGLAAYRNISERAETDCRSLCEIK